MLEVGGKHHFWGWYLKFPWGPLSYLPFGLSRKESQTVLILLQNSAVAGRNTQEKKNLFNVKGHLWILKSINLTNFGGNPLVIFI